MFCGLYHYYYETGYGFPHDISGWYRACLVSVYYNAKSLVDNCAKFSGQYLSVTICPVALIIISGVDMRFCCLGFPGIAVNPFMTCFLKFNVTFHNKDDIRDGLIDQPRSFSFSAARFQNVHVLWFLWHALNAFWHS
jgi:hypothetical protein